MFVTMFLARYEPASGILQYASAGHNEMILMHADGSHEFLSGKGMPLGTLPDFLVKYKGLECFINKDDMLVLYTDGVVEAINPAKEEFGLENFIKILKENREKKPDEIIDLVYNNVLEFSGTELQYDDFTMLITKFKGTDQEEGIYNFSFPITVDSIPLLRDAVRDSLQKHGLAGGLLGDILLAVDEAGTNIIVHAFENRIQKHAQFYCNVRITPSQVLTIEFVDTGDPFSFQDIKQPDPSANMDGTRKGGFGVYLIKSLMDNVDYYREGKSNKLLLTKYLNIER
jgi:sigma-B regulation protein RsbU (phosphoserine phosphatase)